MPKKTNILFFFLVLLIFFSSHLEAEKKGKGTAVFNLTS